METNKEINYKRSEYPKLKTNLTIVCKLAFIIFSVATIIILYQLFRPYSTEELSKIAESDLDYQLLWELPKNYTLLKNRCTGPIALQKDEVIIFKWVYFMPDIKDSAIITVQLPKSYPRPLFHKSEILFNKNCSLFSSESQE